MPLSETDNSTSGKEEKDTGTEAQRFFHHEEMKVTKKDVATAQSCLGLTTEGTEGRILLSGNVKQEISFFL